MTTSFMTKQAQYLHVKQKLDSFNLPSIFPLEAIPVLSKLLERLDKQVHRSNELLKHQIKRQIPSSDVAEIQTHYKYVDKAVNHQMSKILHQNNQLHMEIITLKQEVQAGKHCIDKILVQKSDNKEEIKQIINFKNSRETQLVEELQIAKFKYNQLIDFIHEQQNLQRQYIKRLFNHKKYDLTSNIRKNSDNVKQSPQKNDLDSRVTFKKRAPSNSNSKQQKSRKRINKTVQNQDNRQSVGQPEKYKEKIYFLKQRLVNRQNQITRLHAQITHDGLNLNKVLTQFNDDMQRKKLSEIQQRLSLLQKQNLQMKNQVDRARKTGGRYQALRQEVDKCHQIIKSLKEDNRKVKRLKEENDFDIQKQRKVINRQTKVMNLKTVQMKVSKFSDDLTIEDLRNKVDFYEKQLGRGKQNKVSTKKVVNKKQTKQKGKKKKILKIDDQKQKNSSQLRQKYEDQIELNGNKQKKQKTGNKKQLQEFIKSRPIRQIQEESQQQGSSQKQQKGQLNQVEHNQGQGQEDLDNQNVQNQNNEEEYQQNQNQDIQQKKETLIEQYEQTISELTSRCMKLNSQLETKNQAYQGLQNILKRLMNEDSIKLQKLSSIFTGQHQNMSEQQKTELAKLNQRVQVLSAALNESQFDKQQLRRQCIEMQQLYKKINIKNQKQIDQEHQIHEHYQDEVIRLQSLLKIRQKKLQQSRFDQVEMEDRLLKAQDRIKRLNDENDYLANQKKDMANKLIEDQQLLNQASEVLQEQRYRNTQAIDLTQVQKNQIIGLRRNLLSSQNRIIQLETYLNVLKQQNLRLQSK